MWAKICAGFAALSGILFIWAKSERKAKQEAQHENNVNNKIKENHEKQLTDREEALENEKQAIKDRVNSSSGSRRDMASRL